MEMQLQKTKGPAIVTVGIVAENVTTIPSNV